MINTPTGSGARADGYEIRRAAIGRGIPCITTMPGASAAQRAIRARRSERGRGDLAPGAARRRPRRFDRVGARGAVGEHVSGAATAASRSQAPPERRVVTVTGVERWAPTP